MRSRLTMLVGLFLFGFWTLSVAPVHAQSTPRATMTQFLTAWKKGDFRGMAKATQRSQKATAKDLQNWFGGKRLQAYQITKEQAVSPMMSRVTATVTYLVPGKKPEKHTITGNVIREGADGRPNTSGSWGVNYLSAIRED